MIVSSEIKLISPQSSRDYVIEEHTFDDGKVVRVEGLRDALEDHEQAMFARVPTLEAEHDAEIEKEATQALTESAEAKVQEYLKTVDLKTDIGMTDEEKAIYEKEKLSGEIIVK